MWHIITQNIYTYSKYIYYQNMPLLNNEKDISKEIKDIKKKYKLETHTYAHKIFPSFKKIYQK